MVSLACQFLLVTVLWATEDCCGQNCWLHRNQMGLLNSKRKCGSQSDNFHCVRSGVSHHTNDNVYILHLTGGWSRVKSLCNVNCVSPTRAGPQQEQVNCNWYHCHQVGPGSRGTVNVYQSTKGCSKFI